MGNICGGSSETESKNTGKKAPAPEAYEPFEIQGTWNITVKAAGGPKQKATGDPSLKRQDTDPDGVWEGFMCVDPEGGTFLQFNTGWSAKGWQFEVDGNKVTGVVPDQGYWSVEMSGSKGKGKLGEYDFEMIRRSQVFESAADYIAGTWDFWNQSDQTLACKVHLSQDLKGKLSYENGFEDDSWTYSVKGHMIESDQSIRSAGKLSLTCTPDGTLGTGKINRQTFEAWRSS